MVEQLSQPDAERSVVIDMRSVQKHFGGPPVLADVTLQVATGDIFGLIGPSGSGKTTTVHLCCGHLRPDAGTVMVFDQHPVSFTTATRRKIGYLPQQFILNPDLTVAQNVAFAAGLYGLSEWRCRDQIRQVLELVELWEARKRTTRAISGGMQRRLALAAALVHDPALLFADEPTANLDPILRAKLWNYFRARSQQGRTLLVTTQYIDEAEYCDRVGLMFDGVLIAEGRPDTLRRAAFGGDLIDLVLRESSATGAVDAIGSVEHVYGVDIVHADAVRITVDRAEQAIPIVLQAVSAGGMSVRSIAEYRPTFDEVFIRLIEQHRGAPPAVGRIQTSAVSEGR